MPRQRTVQLNKPSPLPPVKRKTIGMYAVQRIITKVSPKNPLEEPMYLVAWDGYPITEASEEPEHHLSGDLIRNYNSPQVTHRESHTEFDRLQCKIQDSLRMRLRGRRRIVVEFRGDVYRRHLSRAGVSLGNRRIVGESDFCALINEHNLLDVDWGSRHNSLGEGISVVMPVLVRWRLRNINSTKFVTVIDEMVHARPCYQEELVVEFAIRGSTL